MAHSAPEAVAVSTAATRLPASPDEDGEPTRVPARRPTKQEEDGEPERVAARGSQSERRMVSPSVAASKDIKFALMILEFMWVKIKHQVPLFVDNEGLWKATRNDVTSSLTKHWAIWMRFVRECYQAKILNVHRVSGEEERADLLTKPIPKEDAKFNFFCDFLMNKFAKAV